MSSCGVRPGPHLEPALLTLATDHCAVGTLNPTDRWGHQDQGSWARSINQETSVHRLCAQGHSAPGAQAQRPR